MSARASEGTRVSDKTLAKISSIGNFARVQSADMYVTHPVGFVCRLHFWSPSPPHGEGRHVPEGVSDQMRRRLRRQPVKSLGQSSHSKNRKRKEDREREREPKRRPRPSVCPSLTSLAGTTWGGGEGGRECILLIGETSVNYPARGMRFQILSSPPRQRQNNLSATLGT